MLKTDIQTDASEHTRHTHKHNHTHIYTKNINTGTDLQDSLQASTNSFNRQRTEDTESMSREFKLGLCSRLNDPKGKEMLFSP